MTLLSTLSRANYLGDGTSRTFPVPFKIWSQADLKVYLHDTTSGSDTLLAAGFDYACDTSQLPGFTTVTLAVTPSAGTLVILLREMALTQELDLAPSGAFAAENVETQLDKLAATIQTLRERIARAPQIAVSAIGADLALPEPNASRANSLIGISADGTRYETKVPANLSLQTISTFAAALLDDPDAAAARATLGLGTAIDLNLLATDTTGGASADFIPFVDASEANASNKVLLTNLLSNAIAASPTPPTIDPDSFELLARKPSDASLHRLPLAAFGAGKQTLWIPASALWPRQTAGAASSSLELAGNKLQLRTLDFDPVTAEYAQFAVQMPKGWDEAALSALFVWSHASTTTNFNVVWSIRALSISDDDQLDAAFGSAVQVADTGGTTNDLYRSAETAGFVPSGSPAPGDVVAFDIFRAAADPGDTLAVDARLHGVAIFLQTNRSTDA